MYRARVTYFIPLIIVWGIYQRSIVSNVRWAYETRRR